MDTTDRTDNDLWGPDRLTFEDELQAWWLRQEAERTERDQQAEAA